jgi:hypothetical protein
LNLPAEVVMSTDTSEQVLDYPFRAPTAVEPPEEWAKLRQGCPVAHIRRHLRSR